MKKLIFATRTMQDRPFTIGGLTFFSRLITGSDELTLTELDLMKSVVEKRSESLRAEAELVQRLLHHRRRDQNEPVSFDWVAANVGSASAQRLLGYLRTGEALRVGEGLDLQILDEPIVIEDRTFTPRVASYGEQIAAALRIEEVQGRASTPLGEQPDLDSITTPEQARDYIGIQIGQAREIHSASAEILSGWLNARTLDGEVGIDAVWLLDRLQMADVTLISAYLTTGELPEDEAPKDGEDDAG